MHCNVVHFVDADTYGGCEQVALTLMSGLDRQRWRPTLLHRDHPGLGRLVEEAQRLNVPTQAVATSGTGGVGSLIQHLVALRALKPTIFHAHLNWPLGCRHGLMAARLSGASAIVATAHLYFPLRGVRLASLKQRMQAAALHRYIAVSGEVQSRLVGDLGVAPEKVRVVRNGIRTEPTASLPDAAFRAQLAEGSDEPLILTPARLHTQKGHDFLLEAVAQIPRGIFLFAGDGPERSRLEEKSAALGLTRRVRFLGHRKDMPRLLANCDLFVLPSLYEGLPLTVLEAMAAGKPVVATAVGGTDEAVVEGVSGRLVPPGDAAALAGAINLMLKDKAAATALAESGRLRALQLFSSASMVRGVESVYQELLENRSARYAGASQ